LSPRQLPYHPIVTIEQKPEPLVGWSQNIFFIISKAELFRNQKKINQRIAKKNSKFLGAFFQTLGLWQIRSFEVGPKKNFV
jgi:hypothetical protein